MHEFLISRSRRWLDVCTTIQVNSHEMDVAGLSSQSWHISLYPAGACLLIYLQCLLRMALSARFARLTSLLLPVSLPLHLVPRLRSSPGPLQPALLAQPTIINEQGVSAKGYLLAGRLGWGHQQSIFITTGTG